MAGVVMKFGGSSLASLTEIESVALIIKKRLLSTTKIVVVVSAMGKSTNKYIEMAKAINPNPNKRELDVLLSTGEQVSIALLALALESIGVSAVSLLGWQAGFNTYGVHTKQRIASLDPSRVEHELDLGRVVIVAGFQGLDAFGNLSTLGRGGSDTSAVALACSLYFPCEIYTDVDGIYSVDPRLYKDAKKIKELSYEETMEMANLGAKIIEPRSVELASRVNIPIHILLNTADTEGTTIMNREDMMLEESMITNVSVLDDVVLISIDDITSQNINVADLFITLAETGISVDVIAQSFNEDISFTISKTDLVEALELISAYKYHVKDDGVKVSVIGNAMRNQSGIAAKIFKVFYEESVPFYQVSTSEISVSYIIDEKNKEKIVLALAKAFDL